MGPGRPTTPSSQPRGAARRLAALRAGLVGNQPRRARRGPETTPQVLLHGRAAGISSCPSTAAQRQPVAKADVAAYERDGAVVLRGLLSPAQVCGAAWPLCQNIPRRPRASTARTARSAALLRILEHPAAGVRGSGSDAGEWNRVER
jgi:hypothetical protein